MRERYRLGKTFINQLGHMDQSAIPLSLLMTSWAIWRLVKCNCLEFPVAASCPLQAAADKPARPARRSLPFYLIQLPKASLSECVCVYSTVYVYTHVPVRLCALCVQGVSIDTLVHSDNTDSFCIFREQCVPLCPRK